jgi:hypothetical protein
MANKNQNCKIIDEQIKAVSFKMGISVNTLRRLAVFEYLKNHDIKINPEVAV